MISANNLTFSLTFTLRNHFFKGKVPGHILQSHQVMINTDLLGPITNLLIQNLRKETEKAYILKKQASQVRVTHPQA